MSHIREKLPDMKARLNTLMGQTQQELNAFGDATFLGEQHRVSGTFRIESKLIAPGLPHPETHDRVLQRLRFLHRRDLSRNINQRALRRRSDILHLQ